MESSRAVEALWERVQAQRVFRAASFWTVRDGLIVRGREYWTSLGADPRPEWRVPFVEPM